MLKSYFVEIKIKGNNNKNKLYMKQLMSEPLPVILFFLQIWRSKINYNDIPPNRHQNYPSVFYKSGGLRSEINCQSESFPRNGRS